MAIKTCNRICQWVRDMENEIFLLGASPFSWWLSYVDYLIVKLRTCSKVLIESSQIFLQLVQLLPCMIISQGNCCCKCYWITENALAFVLPRTLVCMPPWQCYGLSGDYFSGKANEPAANWTHRYERGFIFRHAPVFPNFFLCIPHLY